MRFSDGAVELCLTLKSLFNLPLRQVKGLVASLIKLAGWTGRCRIIRRYADGRRRWSSSFAGGATQAACTF
jgi:hypothetical protein